MTYHVRGGIQSYLMRSSMCGSCWMGMTSPVKRAHEKMGGKKNLIGQVNNDVSRCYTRNRDAVRQLMYWEVLDTYGMLWCTFGRRLQYVVSGL